MGNCNATCVNNTMGSLDRGITNFSDCVNCMTICCGGRRYRNPGYRVSRMERRIVRCGECCDACIRIPQTITNSLGNFLRFERLRTLLLTLANSVETQPEAQFVMNENDVKLYDNDEIIFENGKEGEQNVVIGTGSHGYVGSINDTNVPKSNDDITMLCEYCKQDIPLDNHHYHQNHCIHNPKIAKQIAEEETRGRQSQSDFHPKKD